MLDTPVSGPVSAEVATGPGTSKPTADSGVALKSPGRVMTVPCLSKLPQDNKPLWTGHAQQSASTWDPVYSLNTI